MSEHDCGHRCCDIRDNPWHDHTLSVEDCLVCDKTAEDEEE